MGESGLCAASDTVATIGGVAVRMHAPSVEAAMAWDNGEGALLRGVLAEKYGQKVLHFTTLMENIPL